MNITNKESNYAICLFLLVLISLFFTPPYFISHNITPSIAVCCITCCMFSFILPFSIYKFLQFSKIISILGIFLIYWIIKQLPTTRLSLQDQIEFFTLLIFFYYFSQTPHSESNLKRYYFFFSFVGLIIACWGITQSVINIMTDFPKAISAGSFNNPAGLSAFLCLSLPFSFFFISDKKHNFRIWGMLSSLAITSAIIISYSRTGILALIIITSVYYLSKIKFFQCYHKTKYLIGIIIAIFIIGVCCLYFLKINSANGRILIWLCSLDMFGEKWLTGHGPGAFQAEYMLYQAKYFQENPESTLKLLASNIKHPLNEYLKLLVEYGVIGFGLFVSLTICIFKIFWDNRKKKIYHPIFYSISAIYIFAFFSYPTKYLSIGILVFFMLAVISTIDRKIIHMRTTIYILLIKYTGIMLCALLILITITWIKAEKKWKETAQLSQQDKTEDALSQYQHLYRQLKNNGLFLYNYGAELYEAGEYETSSKILNDCQFYFNDFDLQLLLANNYTKMQDYKNAENHLLIANNMCPVRFIPLYYLVKLYDQQGQYAKARLYAKIIIEKPIKIESEIILKIKSEMQLYIKRINK